MIYIPPEKMDDLKPFDPDENLAKMEKLSQAAWAKHKKKAAHKSGPGQNPIATPDGKGKPTRTTGPQSKRRAPMPTSGRLTEGRSLRIRTQRTNRRAPQGSNKSAAPRNRGTNPRNSKPRPGRGAGSRNKKRLVFDKYGKKHWVSSRMEVQMKPSPTKKKGKQTKSLASMAAKSKTRETSQGQAPSTNAPVETKEPAPSQGGSQVSRVQRLLDSAFDEQRMSYLTIGLVLDGLQKTNNHKEFAALLEKHTPLKDYSDAIDRATRSATVLDQGLIRQPPAIPGLRHAECVRKSTDSRPLRGAANHNACCTNDTGKARCSVCESVVCLHHSVCEHQVPKRCSRTCTCRACNTERSAQFVQLYREPEKGTKPTFVAPPVSPWRLQDYTQSCGWAETQSTKMSIRIAFGQLDWCLSAHAHQAVLVHDAKEAGDAQKLADASSMEWRYMCGPSTTHLFCPYSEETFIREFLTWKTTDADPIPRWRFTTWSFMHLADGFNMPPTFRELHLDPDKWLTPMLKFKPTARNPDTSDEYEMFLRLRYLVNANDRAHAMRCVDTLRIFVQHSILGSVRITHDHKAKFTNKPTAPSVFESLNDIWPRIFGFLYQNRGEWTRTCAPGTPMLSPAPRKSKHAHFRWSKADIRTQTKDAVRLAICDARSRAVRIFKDPFMRNARPSGRQISAFLRRHGFPARRKMHVLPTPNFDDPDYGRY